MDNTISFDNSNNFIELNEEFESNTNNIESVHIKQENNDLIDNVIKTECENLLKDPNDIMLAEIVECLIESGKDINNIISSNDENFTEEIERNPIKSKKAKSSKGKCKKSSTLSPSSSKRNRKGHFKCSACCKIFSRKDILSRHYESIHVGVKYKCNLCPKEFTQKGRLNEHKKIHTPGKCLKCNKCDREFTGSHSLKRHLITHVEGQQFACEYCSKMYYSYYGLHQHRKIHTGNCFNCLYCDKIFTTSNNLKLHFDGVHGGIKYKCQDCPKEFIQLKYLNDHRRIHTGDCFICNECSKACTTKSHLRRHIEIHNDERTKFNCNICDKIYCSKKGLGTHWKAKHMGQVYLQPI